MNKAIFLGVILSFLFGCLSQSEAGWWGKKKEAEETVETQKSGTGESQLVKAQEKQKMPDKKQTEKEQKSLDAKRALAEKRRGELNNTEWLIELSPLSGTGKEKKETESVIFQDNQITLANLSKKGFPSTNYTVTVQDNGIVVCETMQTSEKSGVAFWRGEIDANMQGMKGILSIHVDNAASNDYSFTSVSKKSIPPPAPKSAVAVAPVAAAPTAPAPTAVAPKAPPKPK
jgi:hypothetical protein